MSVKCLDSHKRVSAVLCVKMNVAGLRATASGMLKLFDGYRRRILPSQTKRPRKSGMKPEALNMSIFADRGRAQ